jgi:ribosomal protein S12 methylthiotransferase accessory factor
MVADIDVAVERTDLGYRAVATCKRFCGYGSGASAREASVRAMMECVERQAQFGELRRPISIAAFTEIADAAIHPLDLGLYSEAQYRAPGFVCSPFSVDARLEWIEGYELVSGVPALAPVEFVYPDAVLGRRPLVHETSSGTAARECPSAATLAAVCEVIERDAFMVFWHRQPPTATLLLQALPRCASTEQLQTLQAKGFVVTIACLDSGLGVPCFLAIAFRGQEFAYGLGCHPHGLSALEHAVYELLAGVSWIDEPTASAHEDHYPRYHRGPFHRSLRDMLARTLKRPVGYHPWLEMFRSDLETVLARLSERGHRALAFDLSPAELPDVHVRRVLVPGLVPLYFGADRIRLGCGRLVGHETPGRFSTLLPHFMR